MQEVGGPQLQSTRVNRLFNSPLALIGNVARIQMTLEPVNGRVSTNKNNGKDRQQHPNANLLHVLSRLFGKAPVKGIVIF